MYICSFKKDFLVCLTLKKFYVMNKAELISAVAEKSGLSKADAKKAIDAVVKSISEALIAGDKVSLVGFGTFSVAERASRSGINPATKKPITIPAKKVAKFKAGAELSDAIN
jgi:DNA-binding protein HU-beta